MAARIFIFVGHPRSTSLSHGMADAYQRGAEAVGAEIRRMHLSDMVFDPDLTEGYHSRKTLEPCLEEWREATQWANHLVWAYPQWWGGMPAKMKGVLDRCLLPGFAMAYKEDSVWWDRLLAGRSADVLMTSDAPVIYDSISYHRAAKNQVERTVLNYTGIKPIKTLQFGPIKGTPETKIAKWLKQVEARGRVMAQKRA